MQTQQTSIRTRTITPFPYQLEGVQWLKQKRFALLADEMGLGKTAQALLAAKEVGAKRILIICPAVARVNWLREWQAWIDLPAPLVVQKAVDFQPAYTGSLICSFEFATSHLEQLKAHGKWDLVIIDEAHFLKSITSKRSRAILGKGGIVHHTRRAWALTGTPAPNHAGELWTYLRTFGATNLSYLEFINIYCRVENGFKDVLVVTGTKVEKAEELKSLLNKVMLRRLVQDVQKELPEVFFQSFVIERNILGMELENRELNEIEMKLKQYMDIFGDDIMELLKSHDGEVQLATLRRLTGLVKVNAFISLIADELEQKAYKKIVVFAIHSEVIDKIHLSLSSFGSVKLYGATTPAQRQKAIDNFQNDPATRVFVGNILAAGTAITLHAADQVAFIEQDWVPGNNMQAVKRVHRTGQKNTVTARFFGLSNSIDERISQVLKRKTQELETII